MSAKNFFKPTIIYKEYMILNLIEKDPNITQREISTAINIAVSMVNTYITEYEEKGYVIKESLSRKTIKYYLTDKGIERMKFLNIGYLSAAQNLYKSAKGETLLFLNKIIALGYQKVLFYGAGEVSEILFQTINDDHSLPIEVVGVIDDLPEKQGKIIVNNIVTNNNAINKIDHDCIIIASYTNHDLIYRKLMDLNYPEDKIMYFFN